MFENHGGILHPNDLRSESSRFGLSGLLQVYRTWLENASVHATKDDALPFGEVRVELINNTSFNALASIQGDVGQIGLFYGLFPIFNAYFDAFMSDPKSFSELGDIEVETINEKCISSLRSPKVAELVQQRPNDPDRLEAAARMNFCASNNIFYHELGHVVNCHIEYLGEVLGASEIAEIPMLPISKEAAKVLQFLELDADRVAVQSSIVTWSKLIEQGRVPIFLHFDPWYLWGAAMVMQYLIMDCIAHSASPSRERSSHPSPGARLHHATLIALNSGVPTVSAKSVERGLHQGALEVLAWWERNGLPIDRTSMTGEGAVEERDRIVQDYNLHLESLIDIQLMRRSRVLKR